MTGGPYCTSAIFCDQVIEGKDGVISAIRIIDTVTITRVEKGERPFPDAGRTGMYAVEFICLITVKSGDFRGPGIVRVLIRTPSKSLPPKEFNLEFKGDQAGHNLIVRGSLQPPEDGIYWAEVYFGDRLLTRSPLAVRIASGSQTKTTGLGEIGQANRQ